MIGLHYAVCMREVSGTWQYHQHFINSRIRDMIVSWQSMAVWMVMWHNSVHRVAVMAA